MMILQWISNKLDSENKANKILFLEYKVSTLIKAVDIRDNEIDQLWKEKKYKSLYLALRYCKKTASSKPSEKEVLAPILLKESHKNESV